MIMQTIKFQKYQATGNDFVMVNIRDLPDELKYGELAKKICPRRKGIGADGLIVIETECQQDFAMHYFNADGSGPIMCGNGARASVKYVAQNLLQKEEYLFSAPDGIHQGRINNSIVDITMSRADKIDKLNIEKEEAYLLHTGAPHVIINKRIAEGADLKNIASTLRKEYNANVNYIYKDQGIWKIRTYERGVEDETLACGTGITAAALVLVRKLGRNFPVELMARGGRLKVAELQQELWLSGEALQVYRGNIKL